MDNVEVADSVRELENNMSGLWKRSRAIDQFLAGIWNVEERMPESLLVLSDMTDLNYLYDEARHKGKINRPLQLRISADSGSAHDMRNANAWEDVGAGKMRKAGFAVGEPTFDDILTGLISRILVPLQTVWQSCITPPRMPDESSTDYNKRCDDYHKHWDGWRFEVDPIEAISFLVNRGVVTLSGRRLRIPAVEFLREHGKHDKSSQMTYEQEYALLANEASTTFKHLALGTPEAQNGTRSGFMGKYVDLVVLADSKQISYQVQGVNDDGTKDKTWHEVKQIKNPLGTNPLAVACGNYQAGQPFEYRFNPAALPLERNYMMYATLMTLLASLMNQTMLNTTQVLDGQVGAALIGASDEVRTEIFDAIRTMPNEGERQIAFGALQSTLSPDAIPLIEKVIASVANEIARQRPSAVVNQPPESKATDDMTATLGMADLQQEELGYGPTLTQLKSLAKNKLSGLEHAYRFGLNPSYEKGVKSGMIKIYYRNTGQEPVAGREPEVGKEYELSPSDLSFEKEANFEPLDVDERAMGFKIQQAFQLRFTPNKVPAISVRDFMGRIGHTNIDKVLDELNGEAMDAVETPRLLDAISRNTNLEIEHEMGYAPGTLVSPAVQGPMPPTGNEGGPSGNPGNGGQTMAAPVMQSAPAGSGP